MIQTCFVCSVNVLFACVVLVYYHYCFGIHYFMFANINYCLGYLFLWLYDYVIYLFV